MSFSAIVTSEPCPVSSAVPGGQLQLAQDCILQVVGPSASPGFWDVNVGTFAPLVAALLALGGVAVTVWQRHRAERSDELWKRMSWAIDHASSDEDSRRVTGLRALNQFVKRSGTSQFRLTAADLELCEGVARSALEATIARRDEEGAANGSGA